MANTLQTIKVSLVKGQSKWEEFSYKIKGDGKAHSIKVCADCANEILESDEKNNCMEKRITFPAGVVLRPDLMIEDANRSYDAKKKITTFTYRIKNVGISKAAQSVTYIYKVGISGKLSLIKTDAVPSLNAGEIKTRVVSYNEDVSYADIKICADGNNKIAESSEANNCYTIYHLY